MNGDELRAIQAPLKERYRADAKAGLVTLKANGALDSEGIACKVETGRALAVAGLHPATGGSGAELCSGDMLLEALVACAGVTMKAVATSLGIALRSGKVAAEGDLDFRGTLGVDKQAPVGFTDIRLKFELDTDAPQDQLDTLLKLTERYCVVLQIIEAFAENRGDDRASLSAGEASRLSERGAPLEIRCAKLGIVLDGSCGRSGPKVSPSAGVWIRLRAQSSRSRTESMDARNDMLGRLRGRREGFTLPQPFYIDPDYFRLDMEMIWYRDWLFVGHDCELTPGSFMTVQIGDYPVVLVRDLKGTIRAFHNTCRHRGSRICAAEKGAAVRLVCPYHQWSYDLDGRLLFARQVAEGFDKSAYGLKTVACESVAGYLFVCLAETPPDFAPFRKMMEPYFAPHRLAEAKVAHETTIVERGNWKLVWENNRECYHCQANHPELCKTFPEAPSATGIQSAEKDPEMLEHWARLEAAGLPARFRIDPAGQFRATRTPLLPDVESYTLTGKPAVRRNLSDEVSAERIGSLMLYHYPTIWNHVLIDHAVTFRVLPISANETAVTTKWLVHKDAVEGEDYDLEELTHVWTETNNQDRRIVEENARGIHSPAYEPGPYSTVHEGGVVQFVDWYVRTIEPRLAGELRTPLSLAS